MDLLYSANCSMSSGRERYKLNPSILKHLGTMTERRDRDVRTGLRSFLKRMPTGTSSEATKRLPGRRTWHLDIMADRAC
jgi:hypothetical protein